MTECPVKILFCSSSNIDIVTDVFKQSLFPLIINKKIQLIEKIIDSSEFIVEEKYWGTDFWRHSIISKLEFVVHVLENLASENEYIVVSDTDIQFLNPRGLLSFIETSKSKNLDFYASRELKIGTKYNAGFYIIKNTIKVKLFFLELIKRVKKSSTKLVDQLILNNLIKENSFDLKHDRIPYECVIFGIHWPANKHLVTNDNIVFNHANGFKTALKKIEHMNAVKAHYLDFLKNKTFSNTLNLGPNGACWLYTKNK